MTNNTKPTRQLELIGINRVSDMDSGCVEQYTYRCPCENGHVVETHDTLSTFREHSIEIACDTCEAHYTLDTRDGVRQWVITDNA